MLNKEATRTQHFCVEKNIARSAFNMPGGHLHAWHELYFLLEGERRYFIDGQIHTVHEGDVILIPKSTLHHTTAISSRQHVRYLVEFDDSFIHKSLYPLLDNCFSVRQFSLPDDQRTLFKHILQKLEEVQLSEKPYADALFQAYTTELLSILIQLSQSNIQKTEKPKTATEHLIESAANFIEENLQNNIKLTLVADQYHLSHAYFSRTFKTYTGFGFNEFVTHRRIQKATQLLRHSNLTISEIAYKCGFSDSNYFSTVFKKDTGISPIKYRMLRK